ncbi:flippase [Leuconostocaceae bacterium ESL0723]|nr:flippase [Leuconostocaceae bacterium ESL0723]
MKLLKNYLYNTGYQLLAILVPLVTMPYISRVLGPQGLGIYSFTNATISYFVLAANLGLAVYGTNQIAAHRDQVGDRSQQFYEITGLRLLVSLVAFLAFAGFMLVYHQYPAIMLAQSINILAVGFDFSWFFTGLEDFKKVTLRNTVVKLATLVLVFVFVRRASDVLTYTLIISLSTLVGNLSLLPFLKGQLQRVKRRRLKIWHHFWPALVLFIPQVASQVYLVVNKTMLGALAGVTAVAYFTSADSIVRIALTLVTSISTVLMPRIANAVAQHRNREIKTYMAGSFRFINALSLLLMIGIATTAPTLVPLFFGTKFLPVTPLLILETPIILLICWSGALTTQYLIPFGQVRHYTVATVLGALVNIALNPGLISHWGAQGAVMATLVSELVVVVYMFYRLTKFMALGPLFEGLFRLIVAGTVSAGIGMLVLHLWAGGWLAIGVVALVETSTYLGLLKVLGLNPRDLIRLDAQSE